MLRKREIKTPKIFYGYWVLAVAFLCVFIKSGGVFFAFSLFIKPLQTHFGWSRGGIMAAFSILFALLGLAAPFVGRMVDRHGPRAVIVTGSVIGGFGFVLLSQVNHLWLLYFSYAVVGVGFSAIGEIPASANVSTWFYKRRGQAIGIMSTGLGAGGFLLSPLIGGYLIPNFGWRAAYMAIALMTWGLVIPSAIFVLKKKHPDLKLESENTRATESIVVNPSSIAESGGFSLRTALNTSAFWLIAICFLLSNFSHVSVIQSQVPYLSDLGFPVTTAAFVLSLVGIGSLLGKYGFGWLCDMIQPKYACAIGLGLQLTGIIVLINTRSSSPLAILWLYGLMMGLGTGSWLPTLSMLTSTCFGLASYGAIFGLQTLFMSIGIATGPLMAGFMYDNSRTYIWAFIIFISLYVVALPAILVLRRPRRIGR